MSETQKSFEGAMLNNNIAATVFDQMERLQEKSDAYFKDRKAPPRIFAAFGLMVMSAVGLSIDLLRNPQNAKVNEPEFIIPLIIFFAGLGLFVNGMNVGIKNEEKPLKELQDEANQIKKNIEESILIGELTVQKDQSPQTQQTIYVLGAVGAPLTATKRVSVNRFFSASDWEKAALYSDIRARSSGPGLAAPVKVL